MSLPCTPTLLSVFVFRGHQRIPVPSSICSLPSCVSALSSCVRHSRRTFKFQRATNGERSHHFTSKYLHFTSRLLASLAILGHLISNLEARTAIHRQRASNAKVKPEVTFHQSQVNLYATHLVGGYEKVWLAGYLSRVCSSISESAVKAAQRQGQRGSTLYSRLKTLFEKAQGSHNTLRGSCQLRLCLLLKNMLGSVKLEQRKRTAAPRRLRN